MIDPHEDDEAEYAAMIEWEAKVQRARQRLLTDAAAETVARAECTARTFTFPSRNAHKPR